MIYLILSKEGLLDVLQMADKSQDRLWLNTHIIDAKAVESYVDNGWVLRVFSHDIDANSEQSIVKAMKYIEKKWPNDEIEVEYL